MKTILFFIFLLTVLQLQLFAQSYKIDIKLSSNDQIRSNLGKPLFLTIPVKPKFWNMEKYTYVNSEVTNLGSDTIRIEGYLNDNKWLDGTVRLYPGQKKILQILLRRKGTSNDLAFSGMQGQPGGYLHHWEVTNINEIKNLSFRREDNKPADIVVGKITVGGQYTDPGTKAKEDGMFPFVDKYGQNIHANWPGKTYSDKNLTDAVEKENKELATMPGPKNFDRFGGLLGEPKLKATGRFRTEKYAGKWWLVDPDGHLFWSHGVTCVGLLPSGGSTLISGREKFFSSLPPIDSEWSFAYSKNDNNIFYSHYTANLYIKYGKEWMTKAGENIHKRFRSWGLNSMGNWSDPSLNKFGDKPISYFMSISYKCPKLDGKLKNFPDVFDPNFSLSLKQAIKTVTGKIKDDPYCVGYFIDNELDMINLTESIMKCTDGSTGKKVFVTFIKNKYSSINSLNIIWDTHFDSWDNLDTLKVLPVKSINDASEFDLIIIDKYYQTCSTLLKEIDPQALYFGSRLHFHYYPDDPKDDGIVKIAAKYCDVVSFNRYRFIASNLILPKGIDKPIIIGEFHFGALDRGMFHTGLRGVSNQQERAEAYEDYVNGALKNPQIVGTHWFQYKDEPLTGRFNGDGENFQIGIIDVCDNPYREFIKALQNVGYHLYHTRLLQKK